MVRRGHDHEGLHGKIRRQCAQGGHLPCRNQPLEPAWLLEICRPAAVRLEGIDGELASEKAELPRQTGEGSRGGRKDACADVPCAEIREMQ